MEFIRRGRKLRFVQEGKGMVAVVLVKKDERLY